MRRRDFIKGSLAAGAGALTLGTAVRAAAASRAPGVLEAVDLHCEYLVDPLGMEARRPRLGWKLRPTDGSRDQAQSAWRVTVATSAERLESGVADLWDSGRVDGSRQLHVEYGGVPLASGQACFWRVEAWDRDGNRGLPSRTARWEMGLLDESDWTGPWISDGVELPTADEDHYRDDPAPLFRRPFVIDRPVRRARLYAVGLGYGEFRMNGRRVGDEVLAPTWTTFSHRVFYSTHDVTPLLQTGENVLGAMLGNGWYNPLPLRMWGRINLREHLPVGRPRCIARLAVEFADGTRLDVPTGTDWKTAPGPILRNSVYLGEVHDARLEPGGWDRPGFDDRAWKPAVRADDDPRSTGPGRLCAMPMPPLRETEVLPAVAMHEPAPGVFVFDLGRNIAGRPHLRVEGPAGTTVRMRTGELLHVDGSLNPMTAVAGQIKGLRRDGTPVGGPGAPAVAWQEDVYTLRGDGPEAWTPRFTFHGFRYVEVTGFPGRPTLEAVEGRRTHTDFARIGSFACSSDRLNRIDDIVGAALVGNCVGVQSDCPGREKFQYGGDIVSSCEMALLRHDMAATYAKSVADFGDAVRGEGWFPETAPYVGIAAEAYAPEAGPIGWGLAHPLLLDRLYRHHGNLRLLEEQYEAARTWVDLLERHADGLIVDRCIGDHESLDEKPIALVATAQFFQAASLVSRFAGLLDRPEDVRRYADLAQRIREAFVARFLEPGSGRFDSGTQAAQATALDLGLVPEAERPAAVRRMVDEVVVRHAGHVSTGIFGTRHLLNALTDAGHADVALAMVDRPDYPGWGYMVENGATTLWETWAASDNTFSQSHAMFGSVSEWFVTGLAGVSVHPDACGFDRVRIAPALVDLDWVEARVDTVRGVVRSRWTREAGAIRFEIGIPPGARADVRLPAATVGSVRENGRALAVVSGVSEIREAPGNVVSFELAPGTYTFHVE